MRRTGGPYTDSRMPWPKSRIVCTCSLETPIADASLACHAFDTSRCRKNWLKEEELHLSPIEKWNPARGEEEVPRGVFFLLMPANDPPG